MTIATLIAGWLHLAGCGAGCASGVLGNMHIESGLQPCVVTRSGIGLVQWAGPRRERLLRTYGRTWCDVGNQLAFMVTELTETGLRDRLFRETDPGRAAVLFAREFERPKSTNYAGRVRRAREFYAVLMGSTAMVTP